MADTYWQRRQRRSDERMAKRERGEEGRVRRIYERELRDLEREIADYYERYGVDGVLRYRDMLQTMDEADRRLLIENCEEFARQHPELADMFEIRKSVYKLDRLEGLRASARYHLAKATAEATDGMDEHFAQDAADAMNAVAETMGYGSSFYSVDSEAVRQFVGTAWSDGKSYSDSIWDDTRKVASYVERDLAKALVRGVSYQSLCREMQKRFEGQSVSNIMRVIQTEGTYVARQAQGAEMRREGFEEYFLDPLGDKRTCDECRRLGRQSHETPFRFEDAEVGTNYPPIHPRCRCEVNPAVEDWEEWARRRRAEHRAQVAASGASDETVAKRFGGVAEGETEGWRDDREHRTVDLDRVAGKSYRSLIRKAVGEAASEAVHEGVKRMLRHRSGTAYEDLYVYDMRDGSMVGSIVNAQVPKGVEFTAELRASTSSAVSAGAEIAIVHNHPDSLPPSAADIRSLMANHARRGVVACHDGSIYVFWVLDAERAGYTVSDEKVDRMTRLWGDDESRLLRAFEDELGVHVEHLR